MDAQPLVALGAIAGLIAGAVWLSGEVDRLAADEPGAVSAAIIAHLEDYIDEDQQKRPAEHKVGDLVLCLSTEIPIDVAAVADALSGTLIRAILAKDCTSKTVEGDFGMFTAMTTWFDERGEEAWHLEITRVRCPSVTRCLVDIDSVGAGMTYEARRSGEFWSVTGERLRWIV
jgi:hypothetical protein